MHTRGIVYAKNLASDKGSFYRTTKQRPVHWPRITLITPTLNRAPWLGRALQSVAEQRYPNLEYLVVDGGSQDETVDLVRSHGQLVSRFLSRGDSGQAEALNDGLRMSQGDLLGWLNSDDILLPGALRALGDFYRRNPQADLILGNVRKVDLRTKRSWLLRQLNVHQSSFLEPWRYPVTWAQPGTYFSRSLFQKVGFFRQDMPCLFDWEWMCRALPLADPLYLDFALVEFRYHKESKTSQSSTQWRQDKARIFLEHAPEWLRLRPRLLKACTELALAQDHWACHWDEMARGWEHLFRSVSLDPRVLLWPRTWLSAFKSLLPVAAQHQLRAWRAGY